MEKRRVAAVVGARGVIGGNLIDHLEATGEWEVIGLSRRGGSDTDRVRHIAVDLLDERDAAEKLGGLRDVTHIFYAAYQDRPSWAELVAPNVAMLVNTVNALEPVAARLEHISLMQGYKVYGAHLGPFKTPARESDPPHMPPEFNVDQQQFLEDRQRGKSWTWSAIRPSVVCGFALGNPMNLALVIAVYATMSKELGVPLRFPGKPGAYTSLIEMTDAGLLAEATVWAATTPRVRESGVQHQQRGSVPLGRDAAEDREFLRAGCRTTAADVDGGRHGRQGAGMERPRRETRTGAHAVLGRLVVGVRRFRLRLGLRRHRRRFQGAPAGFPPSRRDRADVPRHLPRPSSPEDHSLRGLPANPGFDVGGDPPEQPGQDGAFVLVESGEELPVPFDTLRELGVDELPPGLGQVEQYDAPVAFER